MKYLIIILIIWGCASRVESGTEKLQAVIKARVQENLIKLTSKMTLDSLRIIKIDTLDDYYKVRFEACLMDRDERICSDLNTIDIDKNFKIISQ